MRIVIFATFVLAAFVVGWFARELGSSRPADPCLVAAEPVAGLQRQVAQLEQELLALRAAKPAEVPVAPVPEPTRLPEPPAPVAEPPRERTAPDIVAMRVGAIERFVKITDEQRERLREKFARDGTGARDTPTLDDILGSADAEAYREQVRQTFRRAEGRALDKETYFLARRLGLDEIQEGRVRALLEQVDADMKHRPPSAGRTMRERMAAYIDAEAERAERVRQGLAGVLTAEQQRDYAALEAEAPERDMALFHGEE